MPVNPSPDVRRGKLPQTLFWAGMGLAPLAVLVLLFGQSTGSLRVAVVLAVLTIVLLAVSIALRPSVEMVRVDIEHRVLDEMERIRLRTREETAAVARNTHQALAERIVGLHQSVEHLRAQVDEVQANAAYFDPAALGPAALGYHAPVAIEPPAPPGTIRRTETVQVTRRTTYDDTGTIYGSRAVYERRGAVDGEWREAGDVRDEPGRDDRWGAHREEDRWAALRRDHDDPPWSVGRSDPPALPPTRGEPAHRYVDRDTDRYRDDRGEDRAYDRADRGFDRDRSWREPEPDRGWSRERGHGYERDRGPEPAYDRERDYDRGRGYERESGYDRGAERSYERGFERDRHAGGPGYEPERGYDRDHGRSGYDRDPGRPGYDREPGYERDRGYDRDPGHHGYDRDPGRHGYDRDPGRHGYDRDPGRPGYDRDPGRPGYDRDPGRPGYDHEPGYERDRGYERSGREPGWDRDRGHDRDRGPERYDPEPGWDRERPPVPRPRYPQW